VEFLLSLNPEVNLSPPAFIFVRRCCAGPMDADRSGRCAFVTQTRAQKGILRPLPPGHFDKFTVHKHILLIIWFNEPGGMDLPFLPTT